MDLNSKNLLRNKIKSLFRIFRNRKNLIVFPYDQAIQKLPKDPVSKLLRQSIAVSAALLLITSFSPSALLEAGASALLPSEADGTDFLEDEEGGLFMTGDIYLRKEDSVTINKEEDIYDARDIVQYKVAEGDTLLSIAVRHGIDVTTIAAASNISPNSSLQIGQILTIPPMVGVFHVVKKGETVNAIAQKYKVTSEVINQHNRELGTLQVGQKIFIAGAKPIAPPAPVVARSPSRQNRLVTNTFEARPVTVVASGNEEFIWPMKGSTSRGFYAGHYGLDIANRSQPDVWASSEGVVVKIEGGCPMREEKRYLNCNGGYGNNVLIQHSSGWQTKYAHLEKIFVAPGQEVVKGQVIGREGNTGRSYGPTGLHLHFEAICNGRKMNPSRLLNTPNPQPC